MRPLPPEYRVVRIRVPGGTAGLPQHLRTDGADLRQGRASRRAGRGPREAEAGLPAGGARSPGAPARTASRSHAERRGDRLRLGTTSVPSITEPGDRARLNPSGAPVASRHRHARFVSASANYTSPASPAQSGSWAESEARLRLVRGLGHVEGDAQAPTPGRRARPPPGRYRRGAEAVQQVPNATAGGPVNGGASASSCRSGAPRVHPARGGGRARRGPPVPLRPLAWRGSLAPITTSSACPWAISASGIRCTRHEERRGTGSRPTRASPRAPRRHRCRRHAQRRGQPGAAALDAPTTSPTPVLDSVRVEPADRVRSTPGAARSRAP